jgi:hypothetical protein
MLLRHENKALVEELESKDAAYLRQEIRVRKKLVSEMTQQMEDMKGMYEDKLVDLKKELQTSYEERQTLTQGIRPTL